MLRVVALARKELADIIRERSLALALITQFFVAAFSAFLTLGLVSLYDPEATTGRPNVGLAYVGPGGFDAYLDEEDNLQVSPVDLRTALLGFQGGRYFLIVEETFVDESNDTRTITLLLPEDEIQTTLLVTQIKSLLREYEKDLREDRQGRIQQDVLYLDTEARPQLYYGFGITVLLPLLVLTPVFLSGAIAGDAVTQELRTQTVELLRASPLSPAEFVVGKLAVPLLLVPLQVLLWILLLIFNGLPVQDVPLLLAASLVFGLLLCAGGIAVALLARHEGQAQAAYAFLVLFLLTLSVLAPRDPLNLIARLGAGTFDAVSLYSLLAFAGAGLLVLAGAIRLARRRFTQESA